MPSLRRFLASTTPRRGQAESGGIPEVITQGPTPPHSPPLAAQAYANEPTTKQGKAHRGKGGAVHTITGECERFFCEALRTIFLGERERVQDSLGMGARTWKHRYSLGSSDDDDNASGHAASFSNQVVAAGLGTPPPDIGYEGSTVAGFVVRQWLEIWDYAGGIRFRGFTVEGEQGHRTLFVFFDETVVGRDLKQGLMALIELASTPNFACSEMVVCFDRAEDGSPSSKSLLRDLGWVGFELVTLARWAGGIDLTSDRWLFLGMEV